MALEEILETIRTEADATASSIVGSAQEQAEQLLERAAAKAGSERDRIAGSLDDRARQEASRIVSRAHLEAARQRRAARERLYGVILDGVQRRLGEIRASPEYKKILGSLLDEALAVLSNANMMVVDPEDAGIARDLIASRGLDLAIETLETPLGGVTVMAEGRDVDNTIASRLRRADPRLRFVAGELVPALRGGATQ